MTQADASAFWSYAHADENADGRILRLAQDLRDEYSLITGTELTLFVDRQELLWGQAWRECIDAALVNAAFLVPIVTPRYFTREECRRELLGFHTVAEARGFSKLLLPVIYVDVPNLNTSNNDELVALIARTQYVDWTALRLADPSSSEYRRAVHDMAKRLHDAQSEVSAEQLSAEQASTEDDEGVISGAFQALNERLPSWLELVLADRSADRQFGGIQATYEDRLRRLTRSHAPASQRLAVIHRMATECLPFAERHLEYAKAYSAATIEMDPLVQRILDLIVKQPEVAWLADPLRDAVGEAMATITKDAESSGNPALSEFAHMSQAAKRVQDLWKACERYVLEGNTGVTRWSEQLQSAMPGTGATTDARVLPKAAGEGFGSS